MDSRRVLIFRTVARAGSISAGARELGWTQPAVSQHLRALEREVGGPLLVRGAGGVDLTEAGRRLLAHADAVAAHLEAAAAELDDLAQLRSGSARMASFPSGSAVIVPTALAALAVAAPEIEVSLVEAEPPEAAALVRSGAVDLALVFGYQEDRAEEALVAAPLAEDPIRLVLPADVAAVPRRLAELEDRPWVAGCERCRGHLVACAARAGFVPRIRHVTDDYVVVQALVARGLAVAVLPETALTAFRHPGVRTEELPELGSRRIDVLHRRGIERVPAVAALLAALQVAGPVAGPVAVGAERSGSGSA
ncbi:LysR family transcriptional regulator [Nocardioides houyundeii]|uniref:LysR family transcriptional regulator n=1 Tax=Nocardioides houyundeii TaxID=2045452 RepID=UPI000C78312D|nr:LysR family transcriptional regulator [Nocardioides houyundeii]